MSLDVSVNYTTVFKQSDTGSSPRSGTKNCLPLFYAAEELIQAAAGSEEIPHEASCDRYDKGFADDFNNSRNEQTHMCDPQTKSKRAGEE